MPIVIILEPAFYAIFWLLMGVCIVWPMLDLKTRDLNAKNFIVLSVLLGPIFTLGVSVIWFLDKLINWISLPKLAYRFKVWFEK